MKGNDRKLWSKEKQTSLLKMKLEPASGIYIVQSVL